MSGTLDELGYLMRGKSAAKDSRKTA